MKSLSVLLFALFLTGCSGIDLIDPRINPPAVYDSSQIHDVKNSKEWLQLPPIGERHTVRLGDSLVSTSKAIGTSEITLANPINIHAESKKALEVKAVCQMDILPAGRYVAYKNSPTVLYYAHVKDDADTVIINLSDYHLKYSRCKKEGMFSQFSLIGLQKDKRTGVVTPWVKYIWNSQEPQLAANQYETKFNTVISDDNFKQELYFNGKSGSTLKFMYREFTGRTLRGSFSQEIVYDLNDGNEIGFKDALIRVIETSNTQITYEVLRHFVPVN